ncbi:MAG: carbohydrate-binding domain-containing protein [Clostridiales bacterium]|nr:carbohydrate-binding domain-containing protein [Clostridiales bacterium]
MMRVKKLIVILCCALLCFSAVACGGVADDTGRTPNVTPGGGEIPDDNNVTVVEPSDKQEHDFSVISNNGGKYVFKCADCNEQETVVISCVSGTQNAVSIEGNTVTFKNIAENSAYNISGKLHGNIVIDATDNYKFELEMSGFEMYSHALPINITSGDKVTLSAKKSTANYIYDMRKAVDADGIAASVYADCDLSVQGKGSLNIMSENNNGIRTKNDLTVKNLALQVDCKNNALRGDDSVSIESGDLVLIARSGDGIKTTDSDVSKKGNQRGTVAITGGNILIYSACDGVDAAYDVTVDQSNADIDLQIFTDKYSKYSDEVTAVTDSAYYVRYNSTSYKYSLKFYNDDNDAVWCNSANATRVGNYNYYAITKPSGSYEYMQLYIYSSSQQQGHGESYFACTEEMSVNTNYDTIALQSRGGSLAYSWTNYTTSTSQGRPGGNGGFGEFDGNTDKGDHSTKGIKANNRIAISSGSVTVSAYDDALHASNLTELDNGETALGLVAISGGTVTLRSNDDGIHGDGDVAVSGGTVCIVSSYEGIEGHTVRISGGNATVVSTDDGINGTAKSGTGITVSGGKLYVLAGGDGVDCNSTTQYEGIHFDGGNSVIISTGRADSSIDTERGYKYESGYVVAVCVSGGMSREATTCANFASVGTSKTINLSKDSYLVVDGVAVVKMPVTINAFVVCLGKTNANIASATSSSNMLDSNGVYWNI